MKLEPDELREIAAGVAELLGPRLVAEMRRPSASEADGQLLTIAQLAKRLQLSSNTLRARVADGTIPGIKIEGVWRFNWSDVLETLRGDE